MAKEPMGDVVVLLPGILGSVLPRDGKDVWAPTPGAIARGPVDARAQRQVARAHERSVGGRRPRRRRHGATADVRRAPDPGLLEHRRLRRDLEDDHRHVRRRARARHYIEFPYDWRRDNRVAARRLQRLAEEKLHAQRQRNPDAKLILIGHSMGGLVARYFLECLGGRRDTRDADHVRHAAPRLAERRRLPRQRLRQEARPAQGSPTCRGCCAR